MKIKIEGDFSTERALSWKADLNKLARENSELEIDLTRVVNADIVGVNAIATTYKICSDKGAKLKLSLDKNNQIYKMLHLTKFLELIPHEFVQ